LYSLCFGGNNVSAGSMIDSACFRGADVKKLAIAGAIIALVGTPAVAADMPVKGPSSPPPAPVYNWTGWYAGVNAGASFGHVKTDLSVPFTGSVTSTVEATSAFNTTVAGSDISHPSGFIGGAQIGYNWQYSPLIVVGLEADFQGALEKESDAFTTNFSGSMSGGGFGPVVVTGSTALNYQTKIDWFGTVRARIGYLWGNGDVLTYVTGGLAYGEVKINGTNTTTGIIGVTSFGSVTNAIGQSHVNTGWVVGYGIEGKLLIPGWTYKIESLYMDLGTLDATGPGGTSSFGIGPFAETIHGTVGQVTTHSHFTDGILRLGVNYQFH
jgi:outer membrane immunogenic protein